MYIRFLRSFFHPSSILVPPDTCFIHIQNISFPIHGGLAPGKKGSQSPVNPRFDNLFFHKVLNRNAPHPLVTQAHGRCVRDFIRPDIQGCRLLKGLLELMPPVVRKEPHESKGPSYERPSASFQEKPVKTIVLHRCGENSSESSNSRTNDWNPYKGGIPQQFRRAAGRLQVPPRSHGTWPKRSPESGSSWVRRGSLERYQHWDDHLNVAGGPLCCWSMCCNIPRFQEVFLQRLLPRTESV